METNLNFSFTPQLVFKELALEIGLEESIVLKQIEYWISKCGKHILNEPGLWIYNSINEWHKQFSYWSLSKLRRILSSLEKNGILLSKKVNAKKERLFYNKNRINLLNINSIYHSSNRKFMYIA